MSSWLEDFQPRLFTELAFPESIIDTIKSVSIKANPPHLLICVPAGIGKTAAWKLIARQVLGPSWQSTTHVLQARILLDNLERWLSLKNFYAHQAMIPLTPWQEQ